MHNQRPIFELNEFPMVSVVVPACNCQHFIKATLQSLINQSYPHLEIIVTDDGSRDQTAKIVKNATLKDKRIKLLQQTNKGVAAARNLAIRHSKGSFIAPVDADDICFPLKIAKLLDILQKAGTRCGLAYAWSININQYGSVIGQAPQSEFDGDVFEYLLLYNILNNGSSCLIRKKCFDVVGLYNTDFFTQKAQGCEDWDLYLRIAEKFEFKLVREFLTGYRKRKNSMSDNYKEMERSKKLLLRNQKMRTPWIPDVVFNWTFAYYLLWLSSLAGSKKCYCNSFIYLMKAAHYDPMLIKNVGYLRLLFRLLKQSLKNMLPLSFYDCDQKKLRFQNVHQPIMGMKNISIANNSIACNIKTQKSSLTKLMENRQMIIYQLVRKARIENEHLI